MMRNTGTQSGSSETLTGVLSVSGPQPAWMTLDEARERAFTGEIVFEVDPGVFAYLDNGVVYYAERASDTSLGRRLLDAGVIDRVQLERGTVRVGDVEHLGRLFEREASVDRDAVLVVVETSTEDLIAELANHAVTTVRVTAYRHHPSGLHRWFATHLDPHAAARQMGPINEIEPVAELPSLDLLADANDDELIIEWDDLSDPTSPLDASNAFDVFMFEPVRDGGVADAEFKASFDQSSFDESSFDEVIIEFGAIGTLDVEVEFETQVEFEAEIEAEAEAQIEAQIDVEDEAEVDSDIEVSPVDSVVEIFTFEDDPTDFQVTWPDDTEDSVLVEAADVSPQVTPAFTQTDDGDLRFEMPALELSDDDVEADEVPDDVAAAVRRAIAAIEMVSGEVPVIAPIGGHADMFDTESTIETAAVEPASTFTGFAPPTLATSAEVMYAELAAAAELQLAREFDGTHLPSAGAASVADEPSEPTFDQPDEDAANERSSALRRLIAGLRRKDH